MNWRVEFAPHVETDVAKAADWYEVRQAGLGARFVEEVISVWDALANDPWLGCRRDPVKNIHWRYAEHFPYRIIYEINEYRRIVKVVAVLHAARSDRHWWVRI